MKIGVLGGTFDPIHVAHLLLAEQAREQLDLDKVLFVPAGDPWRKASRRVAPAKHRLAMTRLAVEHDPGFVVDECEVMREGPSYTVDTLRELANRFSKDEIYLLLGEDALADLPFWHEPAQIADHATVVVAPRGGVVLPELPFDAERVLRIKMPYMDVSSTDLRERARHGKSLRYLVPDPVIAYIDEHKVYAL
ncbi:MAG TPA: nicotinate-nucleotide adenylyltransferase [Dehalococcoidia bacterium]|nr:nicotinate-nucleotide adenylyltransferase [Dehalococcoidia bacterium]